MCEVCEYGRSFLAADWTCRKCKAREASQRPVKVCLMCGVEFRAHRYTVSPTGYKRYCSHECGSFAQRSEHRDRMKAAVGG